jgi:hypothetical protein
MKKSILLIIFFTLCCSGVVFSDDGKLSVTVKTDKVFDLEQYRTYPFQWIFPEYYYKADIIRVEKEKIPPQGYTKVEFFGLSAYIPSKYIEEIKRKDDDIFFKSKTGDKIMMIKSKDSSVLCTEETNTNDKDYCSAYKTPQEFYHKLFTLTPDTAENTGDKWLVHGKGILFENAKKIEIYSGDKFMAYIIFFKDSLGIEKKFSLEITLFHANGPLNSFITITFPAKDDTTLKHFISTIE